MAGASLASVAMPQLPGNRWSQGLRRSPSSVTAASLFVAFVGGSLLLIASVFGAIAGLVMVTDADAGLGTRIAGGGIVIAAVVVFRIGRWAVREYAVEPRS